MQHGYVLAARSVKEAFRVYRNSRQKNLAEFSFQVVVICSLIAAIYAFMVYGLANLFFPNRVEWPDDLYFFTQLRPALEYKIIYTWGYFFTLHAVYFACYLLDHPAPGYRYTLRDWGEYRKVFSDKTYLGWIAIIFLGAWLTFRPASSLEEILSVIVPRYGAPDPFMPGQGLAFFLYDLRQWFLQMADLIMFLLPVYAGLRIAYRRYNPSGKMHTRQNRSVYLMALLLTFASGWLLDGMLTMYKTFMIPTVGLLFSEPLIGLIMQLFFVLVLYGFTLPFTLTLSYAPFYITRTNVPDPHAPND